MQHVLQIDGFSEGYLRLAIAFGLPDVLCLDVASASLLYVASTGLFTTSTTVLGGDKHAPQSRSILCRQSPVFP
jgi:hypothetical protein